MDKSTLYKYLVSITQFNKGKASQLFSRVRRGETLLVVKNNTPVAVILSPQEYELLCTFPKLCKKISVNEQKIDKTEIETLLKQLKSFENKGGEEYD